MKNRKKNIINSLAFRSFLFSFISIVIIFSIFSKQIISTYKETYLHELKDGLSGHISHLAKELSRKMVDSDIVGAEEAIKIHLSTRNSCGYIVTDINSKVLIDGNLREKDDGNDDLFYIKTPLYKASESSEAEGKKAFAYIENCFYTKFFSRSIKNTINYVVLAATSLTIIMILINYISLRTFTVPFGRINQILRKFSQKREKIKEGDLLEYVETRDISDTINGLIDEISKSEESLKLVNLGLENKVEERTKELELYKNDLERIVEERTFELIEAKEFAERMSMMQAEFLSNMSHELRTPLHAILNYAKITAKKVGDASSEEILQFQRNIVTSGERLMNLVNELLDLSHLESGKAEFKIKENDIVRIVENSINELNSLIEAKNIEIKFVDNLQNKVAHFDSGKITQVIINLLSNAIKFSPQNSVIKIFVSNHNEDRKISGQVMEINIRDEGVGIPENELESIFDKFIQSTKTNKGSGGTGLGLAICKEIIEMHDGAIYASNNDDKGACFTVILPVTDDIGGNI